MGSKSETLVKFNNWVSDVGFLLGQLLLDHLFSVYSDGKSDRSFPPPPTAKDAEFYEQFL